jgi:hypothetical protein
MATRVIFSRQEAVEKGTEAVEGAWRKRRRRTSWKGYRRIAGYF